MEEIDFAAVVRGPFTLNESGTIDCEFLHPIFGWVPFTASPEDVEEHGRIIHAYLLTLL